MTNESALRVLEVVGQPEKHRPTTSLRLNRVFVSLFGERASLGVSMLLGGGVRPVIRQPTVHSLRSKSVTLAS